MGAGSSSAGWYIDEVDEVTSSARYVRHPELSVGDTLKFLQVIPHVRRGSLMLARNADGTARSPSFIIDAPVACRVVMYAFAREDDRGIIHASGLPVATLDFPAGMGQPFPAEFNMPIDAAHLPDYIKPHYNRCPIVIRVESFSQRQATMNPVPTALPVAGSEVTPNMNVHTVFAHLKLRTGTWDIEVLKEHLWIEGSPRLLPGMFDMDMYPRLTPKASRMAGTPALLRERQQGALLNSQQNWMQQQQLQQQQAVAQAGALYPGALAATQPLSTVVPQTIPTSLPVQILAGTAAALQPTAPLYPGSQPLAATPAVPPLAASVGALQSPLAASVGGLQVPSTGAGLVPATLATATQRPLAAPALDDGYVGRSVAQRA
jgi:hypothetical protein